MSLKRFIRFTPEFCRWMVLGMLALSLASCGLTSPTGSKTTQPAPDAIFTAAAQTAESMRMERLTQTAALAPKQPTKTPTQIPVEIPATAPLTGTITAPLTSTLTLPTSQTLPPTDQVPSSGDDKAAYIEDVNIPDGTKFSPGKKFQKTWRVENTGKTTWTTGYSLVFIDGSLMGASPAVPIPKEVKPWEKINLTVDMVAPSNPGKYTSYWKLRNASGKVFGFGEGRNEAIWVQIEVDAALASEVITSTVSTAQTVGSVSLSVDNPAVNSCPHTFTFTALINLNHPASITYNLEGGDSTSTPLKLPLPSSHYLDSGVHPVIFELSFSKSITGWARFRITKPEPVLSDQVNFSLTCG